MAENLKLESDKSQIPKYRQLSNGENINVEVGEHDKIILEVGCGSRPYFVRQEEILKENEHYIGIDLPQQYIGEKIRLHPRTKREIEEKRDYPRQSSWFDLNKIEKEIADHKDLIKGKLDLIVADGLNLPLRDKSADNVVFSAVFGAPSAFFNSINFCNSEEDFERLWNRPFVQNYIKTLSDPKQLEDGKRYVLGALKEGSPMAFSEIFLDSHGQYEFEILNARYAKEKLLNEAYRVLKDNGDLIIYDKDAEFDSGWRRDGLGTASLTKIFEIIKKDYLKEGDDHFKLRARKIMALNK